MNFQFTHPEWLVALPFAVVWVLWLARTSHVQISPWRRHTSLVLRLIILTCLVLAIAGLQWLLPQQGMNVYFLIDRSDSIPSQQQEAAKNYINKVATKKEKDDRAGVIVFGSGASIETTPNVVLDIQKFQAVVGSERTDIASAVRLGTAAFPETGQKRLVILSDFNENSGDTLAAILAAKPLDVTVDVVPLGSQRGNDVSIQRIVVPNNLKKGTTFETKIFVQADQAQTATLRLFRNEQYLGEQKVELSQGKNLFAFPQNLADPGFYSYRAELDAGGDMVPQNNRATSFTSVKGDPRVLIVSAQPEQDGNLASALQSSKLEVRLTGIEGFPGTLAEMQSYDTIFLSNVAAGDLGMEMLKLLESAVRDFGVGLVCVGGDQAYAAGGYRGTPLETTLPIDMELDSKKVMPKGALVLVMHGMEFMNGNQIAREIALGTLDALGAQDEMGVILWDGTEKWLFPLTQVGDKRKLAKEIAGMNQGDLPSFQNVMSMGFEGLKKSTANLKHMIVFSDGDPGAPSQTLMQSMVQNRVTVSTVLIAGHAGPDTMIWIADQGRGRFYDVRNPAMLPQIFIKEAAVILKSAIYEEPFKPQQVASSELTRGISAAEYPTLRGYVASTPKARAETPLLTDKGDPLLAHWQYGLGRAVAFTSDAKPRWASDWLGWEKYRQFWSQIAQWSLRRIENADFTTEVTVDRGQGVVSVEALDEEGNFRNFLTLQATVVSPKGERQTVRLEQTGPGHYEARFPTKEVGAYLMNLMDIKDGQVRGSQVLGASVNYSPEFNATGPNFNLMQRVSETGSGKVLDPAKPDDHPFKYNRRRTFQPKDLWEMLLQLSIILFPLDVGVRRIQLDREEWLRATASLRRWLFFWQGKPRTPEADESLAALLAR
ncbi:MAG: glutamine amidotransferase, partial [Verrucomicrobiota bacterium]